MHRVSRRGFLSLLAGAVAAPVLEPVARKVFVLPPPGGWRAGVGGLLVMESTAGGSAGFYADLYKMRQYIIPELDDIVFRAGPLLGMLTAWDGERRVVVSEVAEWPEGWDDDREG